ncbi:PLAC8-domain-containing protein [Thozetella sp. PMI_491]|nr:PLAC8-domain-containing protein [Thozetella sp. PMI_491]
MGHGHEREWQTGICDCTGPCLMSCCCPCIVLGKTSARMNGERDPGCCNAMCFGYCCLQALGGWGCFLQMMQRKDIREQYHIKGGCCGDCCISWCCSCCGIMQQAREVEEHQSLINKSGYQQQAPMHMGR